VYRRAEQSHTRWLFGVLSIVKPKDGRQFLIGDLLEKVVTAAVQSKTAAGCRGWTSDSGQAPAKKASSLFSMAWYAHIRTCPTVVTSGMTGSEQSFAALYLDALAEWS
jgi:hypothetical protein